MLKLNMRVRSKSLELTISAICSAAKSPSSSAIVTVSKLRPDLRCGTHPKNYERGKFRSPELGLATDIFIAAKEYQKQRTKAMFVSLLDACILQGEIVVVTFLLAFMLNQWQLKQECLPKDSFAEDTVSRKAGSCLLEQFKWAGIGLKHWFPHKLDVIYEDAYLESILKAIRQILQDNAVDSLRDARQSLAILANLLDTGWLPTCEVGRLISLMRSCSSGATVWVFEDGWRRRNIQGYFDEVIQRYIQRALDHNQDRPMAYPPSRRTWNAMLKYALSIRSSELVDRLGQQIVFNANGRAEPGIVAYNILLRGGTLSRRAEVVEQILRRLKSRPENVQSGVPFYPTHEEYSDSNRRRVRPSAEGTGGPVSVEDAHDSSTEIPLIDDHTLSHYITHLTVTGRAHIVAEMVFYLIPELSILNDGPDGPEWKSTYEKEARQEKALSRAVNYGPFFFTTVIHALHKAGRTGLAERVLMLAMKAERASWEPRYFDDGVAEPWCLPVHAYTSMIQCYATEAKKGLVVRSPVEGRGLVRRDNATVRGWGRLGFAMSKSDHAERRVADHQSLRREIAAHEMGYLLYQSMRNARTQVVEELVRVQYAGNTTPEKVRLFRTNLQVPQPDVMFFNAALSLFGRTPNFYQRRHISRCRWRRRLRRACERYVNTGDTLLSHSPYLVEILLAMRKAGYDIPLAFKPFLLGKVPGLVDEFRRLPKTRGQGSSPFKVSFQKTKAFRAVRRRRNLRT
jgi:hypothetical protein